MVRLCVIHGRHGGAGLREGTIRQQSADMAWLRHYREHLVCIDVQVDTTLWSTMSGLGGRRDACAAPRGSGRRMAQAGRLHESIAGKWE
jgi:hypothetical protein